MKNKFQLLIMVLTTILLMEFMTESIDVQAACQNLDSLGKTVTANTIYVIPYVGDIDGDISSDWHFFYNNITSFFESNRIPVGISFYPATMGDPAFNNIIARMYNSNYIELIQKGNDGNAEEQRMDELPFARQKEIIKEGQDNFRNNMLAMGIIAAIPSTYDQILGRFTTTTKRATEELGINFYFDVFYADDLTPVAPTANYDVIQYGVSFTTDGQAGSDTVFKSKEQIISQLKNFNSGDAPLLTLNGRPVIPLWVHHQDFMTNTDPVSLDPMKFMNFVLTYQALKMDSNIIFVNPRQVYALRHAQNCQCGDRLVQPPEECDDGNTQSGDGCSRDCVLENYNPTTNITLQCPAVPGTLQVFNVRTEYNETVRAPIQSCAVCDHSAFHTLEVTIPDCNPEIILRDYQFDDGGDIYVNGVSLRDNSQMDSDCLLIIDNSDCLVGDPFCRDVPNNVNVTSFFHPGKNIVKIESCDKSGVIMKGHYGEGIFNVRCRQTCTANTPRCTIQNDLVTKKYNGSLLVNFNWTGNTNAYRLVLNNYNEWRGDTVSEKELELCRVGPYPNGTDTTASLTSNPQGYLCSWGTKSAFNNSIDLRPGLYTALVYLNNASSGQFSAQASCSKPLVNLVGNECSRTQEPVHENCGIRTNDFYETYLDGNGVTHWRISIVNNNNYAANINGIFWICRCPEGQGQPDRQGACGGWWNGEPTNYSQYCIPANMPPNIIIPAHNYTFVDVNVTQYNNLMCGSTQLDYEIFKVNGNASCRDLASAAIVWTCKNCTSPPQDKICEYASSATATSENSAGSLAAYAVGSPNAPQKSCDVWSGFGYTWSPANWNVKANLTLKYDTAIVLDNFTIFGDYDVCYDGVWIKNSQTGQKMQVYSSQDLQIRTGSPGYCNFSKNLPPHFAADTLIIETCGWSWSSTDAAQICGSTNSTPNICGNLLTEPPEQCDDGNKVNGDGCSSGCMLENYNPNSSLQLQCKDPSITQSFNVKTRYNETVRAPIQSCAVCDHSAFHTLEVTIPDCNPEIILRDYQFDDGGDIYVNGVSLRDNSQMDSDCLLIIDNSDCPVGDPFCRDVPNNVNVTSFFHPGKNIVKIESCDKSGVIMKGHYAEGIFNVRCRQPCSPNTPNCTIQNDLVTKKLNQNLLVSFDYTGNTSQYRLVLNNYNEWRGETVSEKELELCRVGPFPNGTDTTANLTSNPQNYLCSWGTKSAFNNSIDLRPGIYTAGIYLKDKGTGQFPTSPTCSKPLVNLKGNECYRTQEPVREKCNVRTNDFYETYLDGNGMVHWRISIVNNNNYAVNVSGKFVICRCPEGQGQPGTQGKCEGWWNGEPTNYSMVCIPANMPRNIIIPAHNYTLVDVNVSQYNNLMCGSMQIDYAIYSVNGNASCANLNAAAAIVHTCTNCTNPPQRKVCEYANSATATSQNAGSLPVYATGPPNTLDQCCTEWSGYGYSWSPANWNIKANLTLRYNSTLFVQNITFVGDYDPCWNKVWLKNSATAETRQVFAGPSNDCVFNLFTAGDFKADTVIMETCGWSWTSTDAVQICGLT